MYYWRKLNFQINESLQKSDTFGILAQLIENESLSFDEMQALQWRSMEKLMRHAYDTVPFYRTLWKKHGITPADIRHYDDFAEKVPIIDKDDVRPHFEAMKSSVPQPGVFRVNTSGTTGAPTPFLRDGLARSYAMACRARGRHWWGVNMLDTEVRFWGRSSEFSKSMKVQVRDRLKRFKDNRVGISYCPTFDMKPENMAQYRQLILRKKPALILGYPSAFYSFAKFLKDQGTDIHEAGVPLVNFTSEALYEAQRELIAEVMSPRIASEYGSIENGIAGFDCARQSHHIMEEDTYLESCRVKGEDDQIIVTNLNAFAFPLIRYNMEDRGKIYAPSHCQCGRPLRVLELQQGRVMDYIWKRDGSFVVSNMFMFSILPCLQDIRGASRYQLVQHSLDEIEVKVQTSVTLPTVTVDTISENIRKLCGAHVNAYVTETEEIPVERSGKFRFIRSHIKRDELKKG